MNAEKLAEIKKNSFDVWFERYWKHTQLENRLEQSAMKGYSSYRSNFGNDDYRNRRMRDPRHVERLKEKLPGIKISYEKETSVSYFFGQTRTRTYEWIEFDWGSDSDES